MRIWRKSGLNFVGVLAFMLFVIGCGQPVEKKELLAPSAGLGATIGSFAEVFIPGSIPVEGCGLVGRLRGTGSIECPPAIRSHLTQYILRQVERSRIDVEKFIDSQDTAVVVIRGTIPAAPLKNQYFDLEVTALDGTQTSSLENGWLYGAELKPVGRFGLAVKVLGRAEGPIYIDQIDTKDSDKRTGYILAGGTVLDEYKLYIALRQPSYRIASVIRNRLNERFGAKVAKAVSAGQIELAVPAKYKRQQQRFISIIRAMYLAQTPEVTEERILSFIRKLAVSSGKYASEIALEAIGKESLNKLSALLNSSNEQVRLSAARCMLNMGDDRGLGVLREIAMDKNSSIRIEAVKAVTASAGRNDAAAISRLLLGDDDFDIRLAAYEELRKLEDISVTQRLIARNFFLEKVMQTSHKGIFVARSDQPRVVLFGTPLRCRENIFIQSDDGTITINAPSGQDFVSIIRRHPKRADIGPINIRSSYNVEDIIEALCEESIKKSGQGRPGLEVSYSDIVALLKQMCDKGAIAAEFHAGPMPKIRPIVKK